MNKNMEHDTINLYEILKGHEGEYFYCTLCGRVYLKTIYPCSLRALELVGEHETIRLTEFGHFTAYDGECLLFPSKDQRDWNKWVKEQKSKTPKTWSELTKSNNYIKYWIGFNMTDGSPNHTTEGLIPIEKSALALLKIHQLIEVGYGGNVTNEEWDRRDISKYRIVCYSFNIEFYVDGTTLNEDFSHIAFHTKEHAQEFLSYPENIQLLKDYFQLT